MAQGYRVFTPPIRTSASDQPPPEPALHLLHRAGMRLEHIDRDHYRIIWRHQTVASGLTLLGAAKFIDRALNREARS